MYAHLGKLYFIDMVYELSDNTLEERSSIPCDSKMNYTFDNCIYEAMHNHLMASFNCVVPFMPTREGMGSIEKLYSSEREGRVILKFWLCATEFGRIRIQDPKFTESRIESESESSLSNIGLCHK